MMTDDEEGRRRTVTQQQAPYKKDQSFDLI